MPDCTVYHAACQEMGEADGPQPLEMTLRITKVGEEKVPNEIAPSEKHYDQALRHCPRAL